MRLHDLLVAEGKHMGVTVSKDAVAEWKRAAPPGFRAANVRPGDLAEVDFFEVLVRCRGDPPEGVALPDAGRMVLGPRLRVDLRAPGSRSLPARHDPCSIIDLICDIRCGSTTGIQWGWKLAGPSETPSALECFSIFAVTQAPWWSACGRIPEAQRRASASLGVFPVFFVRTKGRCWGKAIAL